MVSSLEQPSNDDVHLHANRRTMRHDNDFNDYGQSASHTDIYSRQSDLSRSYVECPADNITEQHCGDLVAGLEQPSNHDVHLHANCWTMCHDHDLNDYGESASHTDVYSCQSDLSR